MEEGHDVSFKEWDRTPRYDLRTLLPLLYPSIIKIYSSYTPRFQDFLNSPYYIEDLSVKKHQLKDSSQKEKREDQTLLPGPLQSGSQYGNASGQENHQ